MPNWRKHRYVLGVTESSIVRALRRDRFDGEVAELALLVSAPPGRTWQAIAGLVARGIVTAEATTPGAISVQMAPGSRKLLQDIRLTESAYTTRARIDRRNRA